MAGKNLQDVRHFALRQNVTNYPKEYFEGMKNPFDLLRVTASSIYVANQWLKYLEGPEKAHVQSLVANYIGCDYNGQTSYAFYWPKTNRASRCTPQVLVSCEHCPISAELLIEDNKVMIHWYSNSQTYTSKFSERFETFEQATMYAARMFFTELTLYKYRQAMKPEVGKEIYIEGNWVEAKDAKGYKTIQSDHRTNKVFVLGYPLLEKEREVFTLQVVKKNRSRFVFNSLNSHDFDIQVQNEWLRSSEDWGINNPGQYVLGDVMCNNCKNVGTVQSFMMRYHRHMGPICCVCWDHHYEISDQSVAFEALTR